MHYLEPYLSQRQPAQHTPAFSSPVKDPQQSLAMHIAVYFIRHPGEQLDEMRLEEIFAALPERREVINQAISGKLLAIDKTSTFRLHWIPNQDSVEMQRALRIARWLRKRLYYLLSQKRMEYVDTHYLAEGMLLDQLLTREGLVSTYAEAVAWLELAREAGLVTAQKRSHPKYENREIYIWSMV